MRYQATALPWLKTRTDAATRRWALTLAMWTLPILAFGAIVVRRWWQFGTYVPGFDEGSWLAFGRGYFGGAGRSAEAAYAPLVPALIHVARVLSDPVTASKLVGIASLLAVIVAAYVVARQGLAWWFALGTATTIGLAGLLTEGVAHGGYPQNFAFAFLLVAAIATARYLAVGKRNDLIVAGITLSGAALSHHMYFPVGCAVVAVVWLAWLTTRPDRAIALNRTLRFAATGAVAVLIYLPTFLIMRGAGYDPPIDASGWSLETAFRFSINDARRFWLAIFVAGALFVLLTYRRRNQPLWQVAAALMIVSAGLFLATKELRLLPPFIVGSTFGVGLALQSLWLRTRDMALGGLPLAAAAALPMILWPLSDVKAANLNHYYSERVLDGGVLDAAEFVDHYHGDGLVVVMQNRRGWPIGWWFEGLTSARIAVGSPERWLAFPKEREHARLANQFFQRRLTGDQVVDLAARSNVDLLVFRKEDWLGWETWTSEPSPQVMVVYDQNEFMIVDVAPD